MHVHHFFVLGPIEIVVLDREMFVFQVVGFLGSCAEGASGHVGSCHGLSKDFLLHGRNQVPELISSVQRLETI